MCQRFKYRSTVLNATYILLADKTIAVVKIKVILTSETPESSVTKMKVICFNDRKLLRVKELLSNSLKNR